MPARVFVKRESYPVKGFVAMPSLLGLDVPWSYVNESSRANATVCDLIFNVPIPLSRLPKVPDHNFPLTVHVKNFLCPVRVAPGSSAISSALSIFLSAMVLNRTPRFPAVLPPYRHRKRVRNTQVSVAYTRLVSGDSARDHDADG